MSRRWFFSATLAILLTFSSPALLVDAKGDVHADFIDEVVTNVRCMSGTFAPNPRNGGKPMMILNAKDGQIHVLEDPDNSPDSIQVLSLATDQLCEDGERGMHTVIAHPDFNNGNYWLYAFFTTYVEGCPGDLVNGPWNVVARFSMDPDTLMLDFDAREEIWRGAPLARPMHNGGAMAFGNDGLLYITTGDSGERTTAQPLNIVHGSVIRVNDDGSVPESNPYTASNGYSNSYRCADSGGVVPSDAPDDAVCGEIFAHGFRNPFRMAMDPNTKDKVVFTVGDVGAQHVEELSLGGSDYIGANYGWPIYEGVCNPGTTDDCPVNTDASLTMPFHWYEHQNPSGNGGCVAGQAFVPDGIWPDTYKFLFVDFVFLKIYSLQTGLTDRGCEDCTIPIPPTRNETLYRSIQDDPEDVNEARMTALWFGPYKDTQALYVSRFGNQDTILRIVYSGSNNTPPEPAFNFKFATNTSVQFDASASYDPENMALEYFWDFGDGGNSTEEKPLHEYAGPGDYTATLFITDSAGQMQQESKTVKVGVVPTVTILSPTIFDFFSVGQVLRLLGEATDFEGNNIADDNLVWEVRKHHADHYHPFLDLTPGNDFDLYPAPEPEDYVAATNSYLEVILTATDQNGLTNTVSLNVKPRIVMVDVDTVPQGLQVIVQDFDVATPSSVTSWDGYDLPFSADDQPPYIFQKWSDGIVNRSRTILLSSNVTQPTILAHFCVDIDNECTENEDCCTEHCNSANVCAIKATAAPTIPPPSSAPSSGSAPVPTPTQTPVQGENIETPADQDDVVEPSDNSVVDDNIAYDSNTDNLDNVQGNQAQNNDTSGLEATLITLLTLSTLVLAGICCWCYFRRRSKRNDSEYVDSIIESLYGKDAVEVDEDSRSKTDSDEDFNGGPQAVGTGSTDESNSHDERAANSESAMEEGIGKVDREALENDMSVAEFMVGLVPPMTEQSFSSRDVESGEVDDSGYITGKSLLVEADSFDQVGIVENGIMSSSKHQIVDSSALGSSAMLEDMNDTCMFLSDDRDGDLVYDMQSSQVDDDSVVDEALPEASVVVADVVTSKSISASLQESPPLNKAQLRVDVVETPGADALVQPEVTSNYEEPRHDEETMPLIDEGNLGEAAFDMSGSLQHADESPLKASPPAEVDMDESMISHMSDESEEEEHASLFSEVPVGAVSERVDTNMEAQPADNAMVQSTVAGQGTEETVFDLPVASTPLPKTFKSRSAPVSVDTPSTVASMTPSPQSKNKRSEKPWASDLQLASADLATLTSSGDDREA